MRSLLQTFGQALTLCWAMSLLSSALPAQSAPASRVYTDSQAGVQFRYAPTWISAGANSNYLASLILSGASRTPPTKALLWSIPDKALQGTDFGALQFVYLRQPEPDEQACLALATGGGVAQPAADATIQGVRFRHFTGSDAAMTHQLEAEIFATYRAGNCLLFEEDLFSAGFGAKDGIRRLTAAERRRLHAEADAVMRTVTLNMPADRR